MWEAGYPLPSHMFSHISSLLSHGAHLKEHRQQRQEKGRDCLGSHKWAQDQGLAKAPLNPHYTPLSRSSWETAIHLQGTLAYALSPHARNRKMWSGDILPVSATICMCHTQTLTTLPHKHENTHILSKGVSIMVIYSMNSAPIQVMHSPFLL